MRTEDRGVLETEKKNTGNKVADSTRESGLGFWNGGAAQRSGGGFGDGCPKQLPQQLAAVMVDVGLKLVWAGKCGGLLWHMVTEQKTTKEK